MSENASTYAILGMLSIEPMSGYDIRKNIGESIVHFWRESYGQIYPALKALAADGWIEPVREEAGGRANRQVFALTAKGAAHLKAWLEQPPQIQAPRSELLLKLFFGRNAPPAALAEHVERLRQDQAAQLKVYERLVKEIKAAPGNDRDSAYWLITTSYGVHLSRALIAWSEEALAVLSVPPKTASPRGARPAIEKPRTPRAKAHSDR